MYDPFANWRVTGTWAEHMSYSAGGIDLPLSYGTPLPAPAAGTLRTSGGTGEFRAGLVGTAGRRSILILDEPILSLYAIVFQHQSHFGPEGHYNEGETVGLSGASTVRSNGTVNEYGGDIHLHHHGLTKNGARIDWRGFIPMSPQKTTAAATTLTPIKEIDVTPEEHEALIEIKRMVGLLVGWPGAKTPFEVKAQGLGENASEARRMTAQLLTGTPAPASVPAENNIWTALRAGAAVIDLDLLAAKIIAGLPATAVTASDIANEIAARLAN